MLGKIFGRNRSLIYRWIREAGFRTAEPAIDGEITQIEFDEMWHFIDRFGVLIRPRSTAMPSAWRLPLTFPGVKMVTA